MLILTRKIGETIMIGDDIMVKVLGVRSGQVKIGIDAPKSMPVHRYEIFERIKAESSEETSVRAAKPCQQPT